MKFKEFIGNDSVKNFFNQALKSASLPHAVIFQGQPGTGKRTMAHLIAQAAVCKSTDFAQIPCERCSGCIKAKAGSHPDIYLLQGSGAMRSFHVEDIRYIRSDAYKKPSEANYKIYLLFDAQTMSVQAQNALLKVLEEPPKNVIFILTCDSVSSLLPTVCSRAQIFTFTAPSAEQAAEEVISKNPQIDKTCIKLAAKRYNGNIGKIYKSITSDSGVNADEQANLVILAAMKAAEFPLLEQTAQFIPNKVLFRESLLRMQMIFRDACVLRSESTLILGSYPETAQKLAGMLTRDKLILLPDFIEQTIKNLDRNANMALLVTEFCAQLRNLLGK